MCWALLALSMSLFTSASTGVRGAEIDAMVKKNFWASETGVEMGYTYLVYNYPPPIAANECVGVGQLTDGRVGLKTDGETLLPGSRVLTALCSPTDMRRFLGGGGGAPSFPVETCPPEVPDRYRVWQDPGDGELRVCTRDGTFETVMFSGGLPDGMSYTDGVRLTYYALSAGTDLQTGREGQTLAGAVSMRATLVHYPAPLTSLGTVRLDDTRVYGHVVARAHSDPTVTLRNTVVYGQLFISNSLYAPDPEELVDQSGSTVTGPIENLPSPADADLKRFPTVRVKRAVPLGTDLVHEDEPIDVTLSGGTYIAQHVRLKEGDTVTATDHTTLYVGELDIGRGATIEGKATSPSQADSTQLTIVQPYRWSGQPIRIGTGDGAGLAEVTAVLLAPERTVSFEGTTRWTGAIIAGELDIRPNGETPSTRTLGGGGGSRESVTITHEDDMGSSLLKQRTEFEVHYVSPTPLTDASISDLAN